jgi:hypothetical protein
LTIEERGNYGTMGKATHLYIKKIRDDQSDHNDQGSSVLISMINSSWQGPLARGSAGWVRSPGDGRHWEPRQASAVTHIIKMKITNSYRKCRVSEIEFIAMNIKRYDVILDWLWVF